MLQTQVVCRTWQMDLRIGGEVARYDWIYDADGKQKVYESSYNWPFIWSLKQKKELTRLNNEVSRTDIYK